MSTPVPVLPSPSPLTRRGFLRTTATATGATLALGTLDVARFAHAAGSGVIKIGMLGCGGRCSGASAQALSLGKDVQLAGMTDVFASRMQAKRAYFREHHPDQFIATADTCTSGLDGYKAVIAASDAVLIACASKYHAFYAEQALEAGKHVFIEKPHAIDPAGCLRLKRCAALAREKHLSFVSGHESRYHFPYQEMVKRIHDGAIGQIVAIQSMFLRAPTRPSPANPA
ncbi:MAG: Gfo/Idh/MocA family oxidoreductase [Verrucomicrobia bacterium]|nr:Gfo/Idh/MocA family oxidoreductase [Verrucomicrobiota bacterium]